MSLLRQALLGLALFAALGLLLWGQRQQQHASSARAALAAEQLSALQQRNASQTASLNALSQQLSTERAAQQQLRSQQQQLRGALSQRQQHIEALQHENAALKHWSAQPLPAPAQRLRERPALTGADAYQHWLSRGGAVPPAGQPTDH